MLSICCFTLSSIINYSIDLYREKVKDKMDG